MGCKAGRESIMVHRGRNTRFKVSSSCWQVISGEVLEDRAGILTSISRCHALPPNRMA